jgi:urease accessory protein
MKRIATEPALPPPVDAARWEARLSLGFTDDSDVTRMVERSHSGPLRVQKPLYPEGGRVCHAIIVHPPGGVVGGDELNIDIRAGDRAHVLLATPGAAKWYKANGQVSRQQVRIDAASDASIEWLPQETIFFDAAHVRLDHDVTLAQDATYIGCEILCIGRTASGESFNAGRIEQCTRIRHGGKLVWFEQGVLTAGDASMTSALGLAGKTVCATLIAVGKTVPATLIGVLRAASNGEGTYGVTQMKSVVVVRYLGDSSETAKRLMISAWRELRPALLGREGVVPRIWNT